MLSSTYMYTRFDFIWIRDINKLNIFNNGISPLASLLSFIMSNAYALRLLSYGILSLSFFIIIRNIINQKNNSLVFMGIFLFFMIDQSILNESIVSITGFVHVFVGFIFLLVVINYLINENLYKVPKPLIIFIGIVASSFNVIYALIVLLLLLYKIIDNTKNKIKDKSILLLFMGVLLGNIFIISNNYDIVYYSVGEVSHNILYEILPSILNINFIITIILIAFLFRLAIKSFLYSVGFERIKIVLSILAISIFAFVSLLSKLTYLNYISLILYICSSYYIIRHGTDSYSFKEKMKVYYFIKVIYLLLISFIRVNFNIAFISALIDIIIILELVNITFKTNYLNIPYTFIALFMLSAEIVIANNTKIVIKDMNNYLKRNLSCDISLITLPSKFKQEDVSIYLPLYKDEKKLYLKYLDIDNEFEYKIDYSE